MAKPVTCKTCGGSVQWVLMESDKPMPVDLPLHRGVVVNGDRTKGAVRWVTTAHTCESRGRK
jgi:hypothetical protein